MCGIAGYCGEGDRQLVRKMLKTISYRGPDDEGVYVDDRAGLGNRRLSIIDLKTGRQPISNEDGSVWIVYNGELYNHLLLRAELEARRHRFVTRSDTEVFVHAYEEWGPAFVERLRGMYAFALWDSRKKQLLLARDEAGVKPLYYSLRNGTLYFGSEIKCMLENKDLPHALYLPAVDCYFSFGSVFGSQTMFEGIKKLEPGTYALYSARAKRLTFKRFWRLRFAPSIRSLHEASERLFDLLKESVELQLMSDVPLGAFLSGGIDSSGVVAFMSKALQRPVRTFTIGFDEESDELTFAREVSELFGTHHREKIVEDDDAVRLLPVLPYYFDDLTGDAAAVPTFFVAKLAHRFVKTVLTGEGGDELFAGYNRYKIFSPWFDFIPKSIRLYFFESVVSIFQDAHKRAFYSPRLLAAKRDWSAVFLRPYFEGKVGGLDQALAFGFEQVLPNQLLAKVDRAAMANSLEARVPLLDKELATFSGRLFPSLKMSGIQGKFVLRKVMERILPKRIIQRPKHGFDVPWQRWFSGEVGEFAEQVFDEGTNNLLLASAVKKEMRRASFSGKGKKPLMRAWHILLFELWMRRWFPDEY
ncbi:MAG: asparagine synthase (glutamine-hydrolyzing) [Candidatus Micrarchaeia archaeon]